MRDHRFSSRLWFVVILGVALLKAPESLAMGPPAKPAKATDIPVTTTISDVDSDGNPYTVSSDGGGAYFNGVSSVISILTLNGYNGIRTATGSSTSPSAARRDSVRTGAGSR